MKKQNEVDYEELSEWKLEEEGRDELADRIYRITERLKGVKLKILPLSTQNLINDIIKIAKGEEN